MSEDPNVVVDDQQEVVLPEGQEPADNAQQEAPQYAPGSQEYNWQQIREQKRQLEEEVQELRRSVEQMRSPPPQQVEETDSFNIGDDDLVEGRHVKALMQKVESQLQKQKNEAVPDRLKARFPDFDEIVTAENVERLKKEEPELLASIASNPDVYAKSIAAYKLLKRSSPKGDQYAKEKAALAVNQSKPGSGNAAAKQSPLAEADRFASGLTDDLKRQLLAEMDESTRYL